MGQNWRQYVAGRNLVQYALLYFTKRDANEVVDGRNHKTLVFFYNDVWAVPGERGDLILSEESRHILLVIAFARSEVNKIFLIKRP